MSLIKKTVFWFLMLAVLGGAFFLFDKKSEEKKAEAEVQKRIFSFEPADVMGFTIKKKGFEDLSVKKEGDLWLITSPVNAEGDKKEIDTFLEKLVASKLDGVLFEDAPKEKYSEMGLSEPELSVELIRNDGTSKIIAFGNRGPTNNVSFAALTDEPRILRINTDILADADKDAYQMRDKTLLGLDPTRARNVDIKWSEGERIFIEQKTEGKWNALGLPEGKTDFLRLMEMLVKLRNTKVKAFVDEEPKDLSAYGLKGPRVNIRFTDDKGVKYSIAIGERDRERRGYYAVRTGGKNVVLLEEDVVDSIPRLVRDLEEKPDEKGE